MCFPCPHTQAHRRQNRTELLNLPWEGKPSMACWMALCVFRAHNCQVPRAFWALIVCHFHSSDPVYLWASSVWDNCVAVVWNNWYTNSRLCTLPAELRFVYSWWRCVSAQEGFGATLALVTVFSSEICKREQEANHRGFAGMTRARDAAGILNKGIIVDWDLASSSAFLLWMMDSDKGGDYSAMHIDWTCVRLVQVRHGPHICWKDRNFTQIRRSKDKVVIAWSKTAVSDALVDVERWFCRASLRVSGRVDTTVQYDVGDWNCSWMIIC